MTAICKTIAIHGSNLSHLLDYGSNQEKTSVSMNGLSNALEYAANPLKTIANLDDGDKELLVSGVLCQPETALLDFGIVKEKYIAAHNGEGYFSFDYTDKVSGTTRLVHKEPVTAIHLIQSFAETDLDCHTVHQIGIELCERLGVQAVVDTHLNKEHLHNHIIINAYMPDGISKFCLTSDKRMEIRELSDAIQREYGIELKFADPRLQLSKSKGHHNYREWDAKRKGISWKEEMKRDIAAARSVSDNREDFIAIMQDYGYEIARQEANSITWWNKTHTRKIRDKTLGYIYELGTLFSEQSPAPSPEYVIGRELQLERKRPKPISIARYDWNGRRRSNLEILIRKAIALIRHVGNRFISKEITSSHTIARKLELMEQALETVQKLNLEDKDDFAKRLDSVGAKLNHAKSELAKRESQKAFYDVIEPMIAAYTSTKRTVDSIRYWPDGVMPDLMLNSTSAADIQKTKAALCPMSGIQKRDLYLALHKHPEYSLTGNGFSAISGMDAEEILAFLRGTRTECPSTLRPTTEVTMERTYQKRNEYLQKTFDKPIQKYQMEEIKNLLASHGITGINIESLTQYDVINIRNCFGKNPFSEVPIGKDAQNYLAERLSIQGLTLNRDIQYVLPSEYDMLLRYMDGFTRTVPGLLKTSPTVTPADIDKLQSFMDAKGITSTIPVFAMSKADFDRMYGYVLSQGQTPGCVKSQNSPNDHTAEFEQSIQVEGITPKKQLLLMTLRNLANELLSLGIDPADITSIEKEIAQFRQEYQSLEMERITLSNEYRELITLQQQITYAESPSFIFGSLFDEKVHETPEVVEREEKDKKETKDIPDDKGAKSGRQDAMDVDVNI